MNADERIRYLIKRIKYLQSVAITPRDSKRARQKKQRQMSALATRAQRRNRFLRKWGDRHSPYDSSKPRHYTFCCVPNADVLLAILRGNYGEWVCGGRVWQSSYIEGIPGLRDCQTVVNTCLTLHLDYLAEVLARDVHLRNNFWGRCREAGFEV